MKDQIVIFKIRKEKHFLRYLHRVLSDRRVIYGSLPGQNVTVHSTKSKVLQIEKSSGTL